MKTYKYSNEYGTETITGSNKYQEIRRNAAGEPFVRYGFQLTRLREARQGFILNCSKQ